MTHRITFEVDTAKLLRVLTVTNGDYGPLGREVVTAILAGHAVSTDNHDNLSDCGVTIIKHDQP